MMLIGHSIAQSVHLMQRSSSRRNIPRKRSEGSFFCSGYWIVTFFLKKCRPVTERPSKRSSSVSLSSHFFSAMCPLLRNRRRYGREALAAGELLAQLRQKVHQHEQAPEDIREQKEAVAPAGRRENRERHHDDVRERDRDHPLPAESHELVEPVPRERRAEPDVAEQEEPGLDQEPRERRH